MTQALSCLGISSMGCPEASLDEILSVAETHKLQYVELRSLGGTMNLPAFLKDTPAPASDRPKIRLLATSLCVLKVEQDALDEFYAFAELAQRFNTPYLRVFGGGGGDFGTPPQEAAMAEAAEFINGLRATMRKEGWKAEILLETHDVLSSSDRCLALNAHLEEPLRILWDSFHTWNLGQETPRESWDKLGPLIAHVHHHDCAREPGSGDTGFVASGSGKYPCEELRALLLEKQYQGGLTLEWEKLWHPELPHVKEVVGDFVRVFGR